MAEFWQLSWVEIQIVYDAARVRDAHLAWLAGLYVRHAVDDTGSYPDDPERSVSEPKTDEGQPPDMAGRALLMAMSRKGNEVG